MSDTDLRCRRCNDETSYPPDDLPVEWRGYCPGCVLTMVVEKELPSGTREQFAMLVAGMLASGVAGVIEVVVNGGEVEIEESPSDDRDMCFTGSGQILFYHDREMCEKKMDLPCPLHSPSDHHMRTWPIHARNDLRLPVLERICPHNATHPDPDHMAWIAKVEPNFNTLHGACDGCCKP